MGDVVAHGTDRRQFGRLQELFGFFLAFKKRDKASARNPQGRADSKSASVLADEIPYAEVARDPRCVAERWVF
jgi:hypothetical protein